MSSECHWSYRLATAYTAAVDNVAARQSPSVDGTSSARNSACRSYRAACGRPERAAVIAEVRSAISSCSPSNVHGQLVAVGNDRSRPPLSEAGISVCVSVLRRGGRRRDAGSLGWGWYRGRRVRGRVGYEGRPSPGRRVASRAAACRCRIEDAVPANGQPGDPDGRVIEVLPRAP